jgi:hypothetical protein
LNDAMTDEPAHNSPANEVPETTADNTSPAASGAPAEHLAASVERMERTLEQVRKRVEGDAREERYQEFSLARFSGSLLQVLVICLLLVALADWLYDRGPGRLLVTLGFATVLQLGALTAFVVARDRA